MNKYKIFSPNGEIYINASSIEYDSTLTVINFIRDNKIVGHFPYNTAFILIDD